MMHGPINIRYIKSSFLHSFIHTAMLQQAGVFSKDQAVSLHMPL